MSRFWPLALLVPLLFVVARSEKTISGSRRTRPAQPAPEISSVRNVAPVSRRLPPQTPPAAPPDFAWVLERAGGSVESLPFSTLLEMLTFFEESPAMRESIRKELARRQPNSETLALMAVLDQGWEEAAFHHPLPEVRALLLENPPEDAAVDRRIEVAIADPFPEVRTAALRGLPVGLDREAAARLVPALLDPNTADVAAQVLRSARELDPSTLATLRSIQQ